MTRDNRMRAPARLSPLAPRLRGEGAPRGRATCDCRAGFVAARPPGRQPI